MFCDQRGERAREDIIPRWLADELGGKGPIFTDHYVQVGEQIAKRTSKGGSLASLKLRHVCKPCNGGWMSKMERQTKPLLLPMIRGEPCTVTIAARRQIAAWAQLKLLSLDAYYRHRHLPHHLAQAFYQECQPLPNGLVAMGKVDPPESGIALPFGRRVVPMGTNHDGTPMELVRVTFGFKHVLLQAALSTNDGGGYMGHNGRLVTCWPPGADPDIAMPLSGVAITISEFRTIV